MIRIVEASDTAAVKALLWPERERDGETDQRVSQIVADVRRDGESALLRYARELDRLDAPLEVSRKEMQAAARTVPARVRKAIRVAARNVRAVAKQQVPRGWRVRVASGIAVEQRVVPLDRVGCYIPGGRYPLPSTVLMTAIPAAAAGVKEVIAVCPKPDAVVMAAALEAGVSRLFRIGGAQAIAALAYGTDTIPRVDKIVGPGNRFVAAAKAQIAGDCGIDFYAGPHRDRHRRRQRARRLDCRGPDRPGRTRSRRTRRADHAEPQTGECRRRCRGTGDASHGSSRRVDSRTWRHHRDAVHGRRPLTGQCRRRRAPRRGR
jgi:histidinol dehydrogenase